MAIKSNLKDMGIPSREKFKQTITLLSHGYVDAKAFPDGKITVYPWEHDVDDWMLEESKKGDRKNLLFNLFPKLCDLNGCAQENFVVGDVTTILLVARSINSANVIEYTSNCKYCHASSVNRLRIPDELEKVGEKSSKYPGYDDIVLPQSKDEVRIRPLLVRDEYAIQNRVVGPDWPQMTDRVAHIICPIVAVGGGHPDNPKELVTWYNALHPMDKRFLEDKQDELYPHLDTRLKLVCNECGNQYTHILSFNDEFFR